MTTNANGVAAINDYPAKTTLNHADDFSPVSTGATSQIAYLGRSTVAASQFEPDTARVQQQSDAEWIAEYDGAEQLVNHQIPVATMPAGATNTQQLADNRPVSAVSFRPEFADPAQCRIRGYGRDGRNGNDRRTSNCVFVTSCPPNARTKVFGASKSQLGATMATANSTTTPSTQGTPHHHHTALSFVKVEFKGPRKQRLTDWFAVPDEDYGTGNATGYRVAAELMAWLQTSQATYDTGLHIRSVVGAAFKVLEEPFTPHKPDKHGAAVGFLDAMMSFLMFAAQRSNHHEFLAGKAQLMEQWAREVEQAEVERNRQTGQRLAAARKAKRAARMAECDAKATGTGVAHE